MGGSGENIAVLDTYCKGWMAGDAKVVMTTLVRMLDDSSQGGLGYQRCNAGVSALLFDRPCVARAVPQFIP